MNQMSRKSVQTSPVYLLQYILLQFSWQDYSSEMNPLVMVSLLDEWFSTFVGKVHMYVYVLLYCWMDDKNRCSSYYLWSTSDKILRYMQTFQNSLLYTAYKHYCALLSIIKQSLMQTVPLSPSPSSDFLFLSSIHSAYSQVEYD